MYNEGKSHYCTMYMCIAGKSHLCIIVHDSASIVSPGHCSVMCIAAKSHLCIIVQAYCRYTVLPVLCSTLPIYILHTVAPVHYSSRILQVNPYLSLFFETFPEVFTENSLAYFKCSVIPFSLFLFSSIWKMLPFIVLSSSIGVYKQVIRSTEVNGGHMYVSLISSIVNQACTARQGKIR